MIKLQTRDSTFSRFPQNKRGDQSVHNRICIMILNLARNPQHVSPALQGSGKLYFEFQKLFP